MFVLLHILRTLAQVYDFGFVEQAEVKGGIDETDYIALFGEGTNLGNKLISMFRKITCIGL